MSSYTVLGVEDGATMQEVKKAYKKLAMVHHPDKGGDEERFKQITEAYQELTNPSPKFTSPHQHHSAGVFSHHQQTHQNNKASNKMYEIHVSILDAYHGKEKKLSISNDRKCDRCATVCAACNGKGVVEMVVTMFPGMHHQVLVKCSKCAGAGVKIAARKDCSKCQGRGSIKETNIVVVNVKPGVNTNDTMTYKGMGCSDLRLPPGDLIVRIIVDNAGMLRKEGSNMVYRKEIDFVDTFLGIEFPIVEHPGGGVKINTQDIKEVVREGKKYMVKTGGGMPVHGNVAVRGDLFVEFAIRYNLDVSKLDRAIIAPVLAMACM
jgi:DnaJ family protein A protein 2